MYFRIIIPNYNSGDWIRKCLNSVDGQTFKDYVLVIVDDCSTDGSRSIIEEYAKEHDLVGAYMSKVKLFNGGARKKGLQISRSLDTKYTLFLDSDDWFVDDYVLEKIHNKLEEHEVDCLTLPYKPLIGKSLVSQELIRNTRKDLVESVFVACWTKCIKSDLIVPFPENTLMEDVVQHIAH